MPFGKYWRQEAIGIPGGGSARNGALLAVDRPGGGGLHWSGGGFGRVVLAMDVGEQSCDGSVRTIRATHRYKRTTLLWFVSSSGTRRCRDLAIDLAGDAALEEASNFTCRLTLRQAALVLRLPRRARRRSGEGVSARFERASSSSLPTGCWTGSGSCWRTLAGFVGCCGCRQPGGRGRWPCCPWRHRRSGGRDQLLRPSHGPGRDLPPICSSSASRRRPPGRSPRRAPEGGAFRGKVTDQRVHLFWGLCLREIRHGAPHRLGLLLEQADPFE